MGQQQLLLLVLGVIIVGISVAVGITIFQGSAVDANRDAVAADLAHLSYRAQQFYSKPGTMGGGGRDFNRFTLSTLEQDNQNGEYRVATAAPAALVAAAPAAAAANTAIAVAAQTIYVIGYGSEKGRDDTNLVMVYSTVTPTNVTVTILN